MTSTFSPTAPRNALWAAFTLALTLLVGCAPPWMVIKESGPPSALQGAKAVSVRFDYTGLLVNGMGGAKTEAEWVAAKSADEADYPQTWASLKAKWEENYVAGLTSKSPIPVARAVEGAADPVDAAQVTVTMNQFQLGKFIPFATTLSTVQSTHAWARNGQVVDEIRTVSSVAPTLTSPSIFQHVQSIGRDSGRRNGKFIEAKLK